MKKQLIIICIIFIILMFLYIENLHDKNIQIELDDYYYSFISKEEIIERSFVKKLDEYDSDKSICFVDNKGINHLFVFSSPIRYYDESQNKYILIDDRIINSKDENDKHYTYEIARSDITTKFPTELNDQTGIYLEKKVSIEFAPIIDKPVSANYIKTENIINESKNAIQYNIANKTEFISYPTLLGTENEIIKKSKNGINKYRFWFKIENAIPITENDKYITLVNPENPSDILGIIQIPILKDSNKKDPKVSVNNKITLNRIASNKYILTIILDDVFLKNEDIKYPVRFNLPVEMRREKFQDTQVYSNIPNGNMYLSNFSLIGYNDILGIGKCYIKFKLDDFVKTDINNILYVKYCMYSLNKKQGTVKLNEITEEWCSMATNWNTPIKIGNETSSLNSNTGVQIFDITRQFKKWHTDPDTAWEKQLLGLVLNYESNIDSIIFLSNDSALYNIRAEIAFKGGGDIYE